MTYFKAQNANRRVAGVVFEPYEVFAGMLMGVYAACDPAVEAALKSAAANPANGVTEISEADYAASLKKKAPGLGELKHSPRRSPPAVPLKGRGAAVVENPAPTSEPAVKPIETVEDALQLERIAAVPEESGRGKRKRAQ